MIIKQVFPSGRVYQIIYGSDGKKIQEGWL